MIKRCIEALLVVAATSMSATAAPTKAGHYLFVWAGDQANKGNDFLVVVDADPMSPTYGQLVTSLATDQVSVSPHHTEYEMPESGMLFANDHDANRTFVFDLRNPLKPRVAASFKSLNGFTMPHSFLRLPNGHVLASFQHEEHGHHMPAVGTSGGVVEIDDEGKAVRSVSNADPAFAGQRLLPYSLAILPKIDRVIVTNSPMDMEYLFKSNTYQVFRLSDLKLMGTHRLDPGPALSGHIDPEEARVGPDGSVYIQTLSCGIQRVTDIDTPRPTAKMVHQFPGAWCGVPTIVGHFLVQSVPAIHGYIVLDIADGRRVVEASRLTINDKYRPHWTGWDQKLRRLVVTSGQPGDRMYLLKLDEASGRLSLDESFRDADGEPGFSFKNRAWPHGWTGQGMPHGAVFSRN